MSLHHRILALGVLAALAAPASQAVTPAGKNSPAFPEGPVQIERVAYFKDQQITGVAVSRSGRMFVAAPRLSVDVPVTVGEVIDGKIVAYPDAGWNGYRNDGGARNRLDTQFVSGQAVVMDHHDNLWVVDAAAPNRTGPVQGGVKLVRIDVRANRVSKTIHLNGAITPPHSSINDVVFSPDDRFAYLSDVGGVGALVVVNLTSGAAWRVLAGDPSTQFDPAVDVSADGKPLRGLNGKPLQLNVDGIAISADGATFYWQALTGKTVYSLPTAVLNDPMRAAQATPLVAATTHAADGLWIDAAGRFFVTNPGENTIEVAAAVGQPLQVLVKDDTMRWPDSFAQDAAGNLFVSASFIADSPWFNKDASVTPSAIFKISPRAAAPASGH